MLKKNKNITVSSLNCLFFNIIIIADIEKKIITNSIMYLGEVVTKFEKLLDEVKIFDISENFLLTKFSSLYNFKSLFNPNE